MTLDPRFERRVVAEMTRLERIAHRRSRPSEKDPVPHHIAAPDATTNGHHPTLADRLRRGVLSDEIEHWLESEGDKTLGSIIELFEQKSFALLFILLLGVSALPLPTGGATHVFEIVAMLLAIQLIAGRDHIWLPERWRRLPLAGPIKQRFIDRLIRVIRWLERFSRPRATFLFDHRLSNIVFGALVLAGSLAAFLAPPFSGLDTLPSLGVVLLSLGVLLEDLAIVVLAVLVGIAGVLLELVLGRAAVDAIGRLF